MQRISEGSHGRENSRAFGAIREVLRERLFYLDLVERQHGQIAERRISSTEIIEDNRDPKLL